MRRKFRKNLKGISTVIATIIIVAISIVMAIAVAYWALGIGSSFTRFEKLEFTSAYALYNSTIPQSYTIYMNIKNTGSAAATIDNSTIFYNGRPASAYGTTYLTYMPIANFQTISLDPGNSTSFTIVLLAQSSTYPGSNWVSNMNVEVMIQTTAGRQYPKVVTLP